jgi:folate-binding protein YgfZ
MAEQTPLHDATTRAGAVYTERAGWDVPAHYGDAAREYRLARTAAVLFDTSPRSKVEVTGGDAATFLHNVSTNDINDMPLGAGCEAFVCSATARVTAHLLIYHVTLHDGRHAFWLDLVPGMSEKVIQHLDRYVISEQVEFADRTREFAQMHLAGPHAPLVLEKALLDDVPELEELQHMVRTFGTSNHAHIRRHTPLALSGYDIVCLRALAPAVWDILLRAGATPAGQTTYEALRIEAGTPEFGPDIDENRFAPEVGRIPQTICYTKGCYIGQEPIVMARDRGHVQRALLGVKLAGDAPVPAGSKLFRDGKEVGQTTASSVVSPGLGVPIALAYVKRGNQDPGTPVEVEVEGQRRSGEVMPLPFPGSR